MKKVFAILVATSILVAASLATPQAKSGAQGKMGGAPSAAQISGAVDKMDKDAGLGMSAKQKSQAGVLVKAMQEKMMAMFSKMQGGGKMDMAAMKKQGEGMKAELFGGMKKILNPAQFKKFEAYSAKQEAAMKARMPQGGAKKP